MISPIFSLKPEALDFLKEHDLVHRDVKSNGSAKPFLDSVFNGDIVGRYWGYSGNTGRNLIFMGYSWDFTIEMGIKLVF